MLTAFFLLFQLGFSSSAQIPPAPKPGRYALGAQASYFKTDSNYGSGGGSYDGFGGDLTNVLYGLGASYDFTREIRAAGRLGISSVTANGTPDSGSNSGLSDFALSAQYWWHVSRFYVVPQADFVFPLYKVDEAGGDALIGEGAMTLAAGGWLMWRRRPFTPFAYLAFKYRDGGRSFLVPYSFGVNYGPRGWWAQGEIRGYRTVVDDADTENRSDRDIFLKKTNAGSQLYYSINPSVMEAAGSIGFEILDRWNVYGEIAQTLDGANSAHGMTFTLGLIFGGRPGSALPVGAPDDDTEQFEIPNVKYDESVFEESSVVPEKQAPVRRKKTLKKKKAKKSAAEVDKMFQDAEKSLERRK